MLFGADGEKSNITVLRMILEAMGRDPEDFDWVADRPGHDRRYAIDSTKLQRELGWRPAHTDFAGGLRATIEWYVANESWWSSAKETTETHCRAQGQWGMWHRVPVLPRWARFKPGLLFYRINSVFMPGAADASRRPFSVA